MLSISNSVDWQALRPKLKAQTQGLDYNPQYEMLLKNIDNMVSELSRCEVEARRLKRPQLVSERLLKVNQAIDFYEKMVLINRLSF